MMDVVEEAAIFMPIENIHWMGLRDPVSSTTHFAACLFGIFATALLWHSAAAGSPGSDCPRRLRRQPRYPLRRQCHLSRTAPCRPTKPRVFRMLDHSAIYLLIAGTYTPAFYFLLPDSPQRRLYLGGIWLLAIVGIVCKWTIPDMPYWLTVGLYIGMGWVGVLTVAEMLRAVGPRAMAWALWGGLSYTIGGIADLFHWPRLVPGLFGSHEIFHLFAMGGTMCHFIFLVKYAFHAPRRARHPLPFPPGLLFNRSSNSFRAASEPFSPATDSTP